MEALIKRWNQPQVETVSPAWLRYHLKKFSDPSHRWDEESAMDLLDLCSKIRVYCDTYYEIDRDLSTWGVNQEACKHLVNYLCKYV